MDEQADRQRTEVFLNRLLDSIQLSSGQLDVQSLEELDKSLERINALIEQPEFFDREVRRIAPSVSFTSGEFRKFIQPLLLEKKKEILEYIGILQPQGRMKDLKEVVETTVRDPAVRASLIDSIQQSVNHTISDAAEVKLQVRKTDEQRDLIELELAKQERQLALSERRSKMRKSWFERDSLASIVGAVLLLGLGGALTVSMFIGTDPTEVVTSSFLLILGYFFGQATSRSSRENDS